LFVARNGCSPGGAGLWIVQLGWEHRERCPAAPFSCTRTDAGSTSGAGTEPADFVRCAGLCAGNVEDMISDDSWTPPQPPPFLEVSHSIGTTGSRV
jgi:hypothetical protein